MKRSTTAVLVDVNVDQQPELDPALREELQQRCSAGAALKISDRLKELGRGGPQGPIRIKVKRNANIEAA